MRAALRAREIAIRTGTPLIVMQDGKLIEINASPDPLPPSYPLK